MRNIKFAKTEFNFERFSLKKLAFSVFITFLAFFSLYTLITYISFDPSKIEFQNKSVKVYDKAGIFLWELSKDNAVKNTPIKIEEVPKQCKQALISIEDKTFYSNIGVDTNGIARLVLSFFSNGSLGGGSTISQQVVKNYYNNIYNRNAVDKLKEIIYAVKLNAYYSKDQILEMYLNNVFYGDLNYGIGSASLNYFNKDVSDLDLSECAYLAGIPQWPGVYNPNGNTLKGKNRQTQVLQAMYKDGYINYQELLAAYSSKLNFIVANTELRAPHFVQYVQDETKLFIDGASPSIDNLTTSYDYNSHKSILEILKNKISELNIPNLNNGAIVVLHQNELKVMIGSQDFFNEDINGKFNSALGLRQPGTALKPLYLYYSKDLVGKDYLAFEADLISEFGANSVGKCNEKFLEEGCEVSLFNLSSLYHKKLNGYNVSFLPQNSKRVIARDSDFLKIMESNSIIYGSFLIIEGNTSNQKDAFAIGTNGEYTVGVWLGNTKGDPVNGLSSDKTTTVLIKSTIDYLNTK